MIRAVPTPYTVQRLPWSAGPEDDRGNTTDTWGTPVNVLVHGWSPPAEDLENTSRADTVIHDLDLYAPAGTTANPQDRFVVDGMTYDVVGYVQDYTHGPWEWAAGVRINLKHMEG